MKTFGYALMLVGIIIISMGIKGRKLSDIPGDFTDLSVALATADSDAVSDVLKREGEPVSTDDAFSGAFESVAARTTGAASAGLSSVTSETRSGKRSVDDLVALGKKLRSEGFTVSENKALGDNPKPGVHMAKGYHYKFDNSGAIDVNWPNKAQEPDKMDALAPTLRRAGFHVLWRVKGHYNHLHADIS